MKVKKIHKKLFLILIGLILFFPFRTAHADIFGISESFWGYLEMALDALDFFDSTILNFLWKILVLLVSSYGLSLIGAGVFDWAVNLPINLGIADPSKNPMIWAGWNFCRGIANIFLIVILALIAITYILRIQTLGGKKALARLIIVALLINFSMFFVGAAVDLTNIIINGIISALGGVNLTSLILSNLTPAYTSLITLYTGWLVGYFATALIPIANVAYIVGMIFFFILALFLGFLLFTFVIIILGFVLGFVTLIIGILFLFRIAIIWILTIISPLAFLCWILPQTKKYWNDWIKLLTQWLIWGILAVFFVGLGIKLSGVMPKPTSDIQLFGVTVFPAVIGQYLFLIVYFGVVYYFVLKQYTPELAAFLMGAATGILARGAPIVTAPIRRRVGKRYERFLTEQKKREEMFKEKEKRREKLTMKEKLQKYGGKIAAAPGLLYYRMRKTTPEIEARKRIGEAKKKMNVLTTDSLREVLKNPRANAIERVTAMEILAERGKLKDEYTKYLDFYRIQHGDVGKILKARPDWAPHFGLLILGKT